MENYKDFYDRVGEEIGWNFDSISCISEGEEWDFYGEVLTCLSKERLWLDIGIGGGEKVLKIADNSLVLIGVDSSDGMISTAKKNLLNSGKRNVRFYKMDGSNLIFPDGFFDIVTTRHCEFNATEAARVLKLGGVFMTQQVEINDKKNIAQAFGRGQMKEQKTYLAEKYARELQEAGFDKVSVRYYDAKEFYKTYEDLIFLLKYTPIVSDFGSKDADFKILEDFINKNMTDKGIETNSNRSLIVAVR